MKRVFSIFLVIAIVLGMFATMASAAETFNDVSASAWYAGDVAFVAEKGLMNGTGENQFSPNNTTTRAMVATILWRLAGSPAPKEASGFVDVPDGKWYSDAVAWMKEVGLTNGKGNNKFGTNDPITREELATFLYRYWEAFDKKPDEEPILDDCARFLDLWKVNQWAFEAVCWAVGNSIIRGNNGALLPFGNATRAEFAAMLHRYIDPESAKPEEPEDPNQPNDDVTLVDFYHTGEPVEPEYYVGDLINLIGLHFYAKYSDGTIVEFNMADAGNGVKYTIPAPTESGPVGVVFTYCGLSTTVTYYAKVVTEVIPLDAEAASEFGNSLIRDAGGTVDMTRTEGNSSYQPYPSYSTEYLNAHGGQPYLEEKVESWVKSNVKWLSHELEVDGLSADYFYVYKCRCFVKYSAESDKYYIIFLYKG